MNPLNVPKHFLVYPVICIVQIAFTIISHWYLHSSSLEIYHGGHLGLEKPSVQYKDITTFTTYSHAILHFPVLLLFVCLHVLSHLFPNRLDAFNIIKYPLTTESAMKKIEDNNTLVFIIDRLANKYQIKSAVKKVSSSLLLVEITW